jgi:hypothetical protein
LEAYYVVIVIIVGGFGICVLGFEFWALVGGGWFEAVLALLWVGW